jgi:Concanavalin A-like lectin/glucanases superfamily
MTMQILGGGIQFSGGASFLSWDSYGASDAYRNYVSLLLSGDGTNGAANNTFVDSSSNNFTITRTGTATQGSANPFGGSYYSNSFNGSTDYLTTPANAAFGFGTGDFTVEAWVYTTTRIGSGNFGSQIAGCQIFGTSADWLFNISPTGNLYFQIGNSATGAILSTSTVPLNTWTHVALVRSSGTVTLYINGANAGGSASYTTSISNVTTPFSVGGASNGSANSLFAGYISNLRVVKGTAVYTSSFTPPTAPLTAITNTSLLTCQSARFVDNSTNNVTFTITGTPSVQAYSPVSPAQPYAAATNGGSMYFNGSSDYLTIPSNAAFAFGTGDFTVEAWVYPTSFTNINSTILSNNLSSWQSGAVVFKANHNGSIGFGAYDFNSGGADLVSYSNTGLLNTWTHVALVRSGTTFTLYVNGVSRSTATSSISVNFSSTNTLIGYDGSYDGSSSYYAGYISNLRAVKGTAVYTSAFTPPTAPLTAIANTSLLLSGTAAGIYDLTQQNDFITVGSTAVNTTTFKYGTGSISLNGSSYLQASTKPQYSFYGDFTVEFWLNFSAHGSYGGIIACADSSGWTNGWNLIFNQTTNNLRFEANGGGINFNTATALSTNTWYHIALVRSSGTIKIYINGVADANSTTSTAAFLASSNPLLIGIERTFGLYTTGYLDDVRITNGYARYTGTFTPPTTNLPIY